ncbi:hypothetical protein [Streptomyces sp. NPDC056304]|uniref:hypothetical protein n=1 Tax=Streptomyces sp. NPDC056304 TaxID=3345778 RepID=UPI0035E2540F
MPPIAERSKGVLKSMRRELVSLTRHIAPLEEDPSPSPAQTHRQDDDPLGPRIEALDALNRELFDGLQSVNDEPTGFAPRLARIEGSELRGRLRPCFPLLVISPDASVAARAVQGRQPEKAAPHA